MGVFAGPAVVFGVLLVLYGGRLLWTGKNFSGFLGRGFTRGDQLRMKRAPATFFRAVGTLTGLAVIFLVFIGAVFALVPTHPDGRVRAMVLAGMGLFMIAMVVSIVWLLWVTGRYQLFRWNKP